MRIVDYVGPERVRLGLSDTDVAGTIRALVDQLARSIELDDADALVQALLAREAAHTTALDRGVAVPHTTLPGLDDSVIAIGVAPDGVPFGPGDAAPVRIVVLLLSPPEATARHIKLLARIARLARRGFVDELLSASSPEELVARLERTEAEIG